MIRRRRVLVVGTVAAAMLSVGPLAIPLAASGATPHGAAAPAAAPWGRATAVPGLAALNKGLFAAVLSVSCPSVGNCLAGGYYKNYGKQGFVVGESNGRWHKAIEVPGLATLNKGGPAQVDDVSCASAGNCAASGFYRDGSSHQQGFVVSKNSGRWRQAIEVPGLAALNGGGYADVKSVSCASAGNCSAAGFYTDASGHAQAFVVSESNGRWRQAIEVPGLAALNTGGNAGVDSVSCASAASCSAGGFYTSKATSGQRAFAVSERNGIWGTAQQVAANLSTGVDTFVDAVSCASPGNCSAGGQYGNGSMTEAFVISQVNGTWAAAHAVVGTASATGDAEVTSVSCASAGNCAAGGQFDYGGYNAAFLVNEKNGTWGKMMYVPGLNRVSRDAYLHSVSCASPGNCAVGGDYDLGPFLAVETNGVWGKQTPVPGTLRVDGVYSVSCASAGSCVAGGDYAQTRGRSGYVT